ncbi:Transcriptional regulator, HxlR family [hydrothermal vent metagenome]|uniref:Transcriptional regulator, HxlR family n=1 Tax=hydrothermal vent metagenome TaxID=652676 RepID=A0A3B0S9T5_9ZZZZ
MATEKSAPFCPVASVVDTIAGRWKLIILHWLIQGPRRFNQLQRDLGAITHRTLSRQLREMEEDGIVHRKDFRTVPPHVEYSLTPLGQSLSPVLKAMQDWAMVRKRALGQE